MRKRFPENPGRIATNENSTTERRMEMEKKMVPAMEESGSVKAWITSSHRNRDTFGKETEQRSCVKPEKSLVWRAARFRFKGDNPRTQKNEWQTHPWR